MNKIIIIGRQATGKFQLLKEFEEAGFKTLKTHTTRPKRYDGEDTYIFHDNIESIDPSSMYLKEEINGHIYFTTFDDLLEADVMTLTPKGAIEVMKLFPSKGFKFLYLTADDKESSKKIKERNISDIERKKRKDFDDEQFKIFDIRIEDGETQLYTDNLPKNIIQFFAPRDNKYKDTDLINRIRLAHNVEKNLYKVILLAIELRKYEPGDEEDTIRFICDDSTTKSMYIYEAIYQALDDKHKFRKDMIAYIAAGLFNMCLNTDRHPGSLDLNFVASK